MILRTAYKSLVPEQKRVQMRVLFDKAFSRPFADKQTLGGRCQWTILTRDLTDKSIIYSGGIGEDISFELALIERFGCDIQIFDPSPAGTSTILRAAAYREKLHFHPLGLAGSGKAIRAQAKEWENEIFFYKDPDEMVSPFREVTVPCTTIPAEFQTNGHSGIDLLKLDIEGFEHEVLDSCLGNGIVPRQICVEFHHFFPGGSKSTTAKTIWKLRRAGYRLVHKSYYDWTFYLQNYL